MVENPFCLAEKKFTFYNGCGSSFCDCMPDCEHTLYCEEKLGHEGKHKAGFQGAEVTW